MGSLSFYARGATDQGKSFSERGVVNYKSPDPNGKACALLLTTALLYHRTKLGDPNFETKHDGLDDESTVALATTLVEAEASRTNRTILGTTREMSGYEQQLSNMDIIFNFFLWCSVAGIKLEDQL